MSTWAMTTEHNFHKNDNNINESDNDNNDDIIIMDEFNKNDTCYNDF
jgi:hypothetical protein